MVSRRTEKRFVARSLVALLLSSQAYIGPGALLPAFAVDPNIVIGLNNEGVKALNANNFALAIQKFQEALKQDPGYNLAKENLAIAHNNYGLQLAKSNPQEALKQFHQAYYLNRSNATTAQNVDGIIRMLGKDPRKFEDRVALGDQSRLKADFVGAIIEYSEAVKLKADAKVFTKLGDVYRVRDELDNAIAAYKNAASSGDSAEVEVKLGQALQAKGDLPSAVQAFGKALGFKPDDTDTLDALQAAWEDALKKDPVAPDNHIGLGQALQFRGDFGGAEAEYKQAIALSPGRNNATASKLLAALPELKKKSAIDKHINNGVDLFTRKLYAPALEEFKIAAGLDPNNDEIWMNIGTVYQATEDYDKALEAYSKSLQLNPKNDKAKQGYTSCTDLRNAKNIAQAEQAGGDLYKAGKYDEAIAKYKELIGKDPKNAAYHYNLGACYQMQKNFDLAISEYRSAVSFDAKTKTYQDALDSALKAKAEPIIAAAVKKHEAEDYTGAIEGYQQALAIQPNNAPLWFNLASAQYSREDYARARDAYQKAYEIDPKGQIDDLYFMAVIDEHFNKGTQALGEYQKYASQNLGRYQKEAKERMAALNKDITACQHIKSKAELANEKGAEDAFNQAAALQKGGKVDEAIPLAQKAVQMMPKEADYVAFLGSLYQQKGNFDDAIAQYKQAQAIDPKDPKFQQAIDGALADKAAPIGEQAVKKQQEGDLAGAIALYQQALAILPNNAGLWRNLGSAYQAMDQFQQARDAYQKAYNADPKAEVDNLYYMALIDEHFNKGTVALDEYKKYVAAAPSGQWASQAKARIPVLTKNPGDTQKLQTQQEIKIAQQADAALSAAVDAYNKKDYDGAITSYQKALQLRPNDATILYSVGAVYQAKEDWDNAIIWYQKAASADPKNTAYGDALSAAQVSKVGPMMEEGYKKQLAKDYQGAIELYKKGLDSYPNNAAGWTSLGACYQAIDDFSNARNAYQKGYDTDKKSQSENLYFIGVLDENFNQGTKALQDYQSYLIANPKGAYVAMAQARISALKANPNEVQKLQTQEQAQASADAQTAYDTALKLQQEQKFDEAIESYKKAISISPNTYAYVYALATCFDNKGDLDNAIEYYKKAIAIDPKQADPKTYLKSAQQRKAAPLSEAAIAKQTAATPDLPGAIMDYEASVQIWQDAGTFQNMGTAYQGMENFPKALASYKKALQLDSNPTITGESYYYLGTLYEQMKQPALAVVEYKNYITKLPNGPNVGTAKERIKLLAPPTKASGGRR